MTKVNIVAPPPFFPLPCRDEIDTRFFPLSWVGCVRLGVSTSSSSGEDKSPDASPNPSSGVSKLEGNTPKEGAYAKFPVAAVSLNIISNKSALSKPFSRNFAASGTSYKFKRFF